MNRAGLLIVAMLLLWAGAARAADTVYYYSSDTIHSEVVITDASRNVVERTYYAPYGAVLNRDLRDGPGYGGHEEDPETDLVYMQQRYYDPEAGRFLSTDPVQADGNGGSFNRYAYANDNPYRYTDPFGMCTGSHISNSDGTCASSGDFTTQASNAHLVGASAAQRSTILGLRSTAAGSATASHSQPQSTQSHVDSNSTQPRSFVIKGAENDGSYQDYSYQLLDAHGMPITGSGYSAEEHEVPASLVTNSNNVFGGLDHGVFHDIVGWKHPIGPNYGSGIVITFQTFSVTDKNGRLFNLSTEFMHVNAYYSLSPYGIYVNYVLPVKP